MKNWLFVIIFNNLGRLFNNPQLFHRIEDRIADSTPVRLLARTIVGFYQRGSWELKQIKDDLGKSLDGETLQKGQEMLSKRLKEFEEEARRRSSRR